MSFGDRVECGTQIGDAGMDVIAVYGVYPFGKEYACVLFYLSCGRAEDGYLDIVELHGVCYYRIIFEFGRLLGFWIAAYDACYFKVGRFLKSLKYIATDVTITDDGCSDFFHTYTIL